MTNLVPLVRWPALGIALALAALAGCRGNTIPGEPCARTRECIPGAICYSGTCVGEGVLRFTLTWEANSDYDLHVTTPNGVEISWENVDADGGRLDVDDCVSGMCADPVGTHVENIHFPDSAPPGLYVVWAENYDGLDGGPFTIEVSTGDTFDGTLPPAPMSVSDTYEATF